METLYHRLAGELREQMGSVGQTSAQLRHETAALVTWLTYAVYLHARNQRSWAGRPAALLLVVGFGMVLVTYSGTLWFSGLHAYSGL